MNKTKGNRVLALILVILWNIALVAFLGVAVLMFYLTTMQGGAMLVLVEIAAWTSISGSGLLVLSIALLNLYVYTYGVESVIHVLEKRGRQK